MPKAPQVLMEEETHIVSSDQGESSSAISLSAQAANAYEARVSAPFKERLSWAFFDFANSSYSTVVSTTIFSAYFVSTIAGKVPGLAAGQATLLWTITVAIANGIVLLMAPIVGTLADTSGSKKKFLAITALGCFIFTAMLSMTQPGGIAFGMIIMILSNTMFCAGENIAAAFLPEIAAPAEMGRVSALGWTVGYIGGLLSLGISLAYVTWAHAHGMVETQYVPHTMLIAAGLFGLGTLPLFLFLKERARPQPLKAGETLLNAGFKRLAHTFQNAKQYEDLFRFLFTLLVYNSGIATVIVIASVYAQQVMGFTTSDTIIMILVVNITAAIGAYVFGFVQDKIGSVKTIYITLALWITATVMAYFTESRIVFWILANLIGIAMGSSASAGRALIGHFSPPGRSGEFFGLWGLAIKMSAITGPMTYGLISYLTAGNQRLAILSTVIFFITGAALLATVNEKRGKEAALAD